MKRLFTTTLFLFLTTIVTQAQVRPYIRAGVGVSRATTVHAGAANGLITVDYNRQTLVSSASNQLLLAGNLGAGITIPVQQGYYIQAEVNVEQKGAAVSIGRLQKGVFCDPAACFVYPAEGRYANRLTYLTLPVMLGYRLGKTALALGPYVGYLLGRSEEGSYTASTGDKGTINTIDNYKKVDIGVSVGIAYMLSTTLAIDLRYNQGLRPSTNPYQYEAAIAGYLIPIDERLVNQSAQLSARYYLLR